MEQVFFFVSRQRRALVLLCTSPLSSGQSWYVGPRLWGYMYDVAAQVFFAKWEIQGPFFAAVGSSRTMSIFSSSICESWFPRIRQTYTFNTIVHPVAKLQGRIRMAVVV